MIDLNNFKGINDTYGHNKVLIHIASSLTKFVRKHD